MNTEQKVGTEDRLEFVPVSLDWWPLGRFAAIVGWSRRKVESKIARGQWSEGTHYRYDPDGEIHINIRRYNEWVQSGQASKSGKNQSRSGSTGTVREFGKPSTGAPRQLT